MRALLPVVCILALAPLARADDLQARALNGFFEPTTLQARAGDRVLFVNDDDRPHTVTSAWDDAQSLHVVLKGGESVRVTFAQPGSYPVRCVPHSTADAGGAHGMVMTVEVASAAWGDSASREVLAMGAAAGLVAVVFTARVASTPLRRWLR